MQILEALRDYVAIPNVTADGANVRRNAQYLASELKRRGLNAELLEKQGVNPVVYANRIEYRCQENACHLHPLRWAAGPPN